MAITENLDAFFDDFGVTCTAGAVTALGILDMPSQVLLSDAILSTDYTLTTRASNFGTLKYDDSITVDGVNYKVRDVQFVFDGALVQISMQKT